MLDLVVVVVAIFVVVFLAVVVIIIVVVVVVDHDAENIISSIMVTGNSSREAIWTKSSP